jgi:HEAT repeat protein
MRKILPRNEKKQPKAAPGGPGKSRRSFEWPLLIYPVLFLATLGLLYVVNRSIEKGVPTPVKPPHAGQEQSVTPGLPAGTAAEGPAQLASGAAGYSGESLLPTDGREKGSPTLSDSQPTGPAGRTSSVVGKMQHAVDLSRLKGAAKTVALLRIAVDENDRTKIKQCLEELVALGDEAIAPLSNLMAGEQSDAALWAAAALARIGTPLAAGTLLDRLAQTTDGSYKEELCKRVASIGNHDSWTFLLDTMIQATDSTVVRAAGTSLSAMADAPILDEVTARYDSATTEAEVDRLAQVVRNIRSPKATATLLSLAGDPSVPPQDGLQEAAIEALAKVGDAQSVSYLLRRLEACAPGQDTQVFNTITRIDSPEAQTSLLYAAAGNKEVSAEHGQTAAILALKNYPNEQTVALLERIIAQEHNDKVLTAATRTLDGIKQSPQAVAAKADDLLKSEQMVPLKTLEK